MAQEDTAKLSKRAQRRKTQAEQGEPEEAVDTAESEPSGAGSAPAEAAPAAAPGKTATEPANRRGRRSAAAKARAVRKRERAEASAMGLDASEMVDDALVRLTDKVSRWVRKQFNVLQWVLVIGVVGGLAYGFYGWRKERQAARTSDALFVAVRAEEGRIGDPEEQGKPDSRGMVDPAPIFRTADERFAAALKAYDEALPNMPPGGARAFASLGRAGVLFGMGKFDEALSAYEQVKSDVAAQTSPILQGHALEGALLSREGKGDLEGAAKAGEELAKVQGFEETALYQQARLKHLAGDHAAAKGLLKQLFEKLGPPPATSPGSPPPAAGSYVRSRAVQIAAVIDPLEQDVHIPRASLDNAALEEMIRQMQEDQAASDAPASAPPQ